MSTPGSNFPTPPNDEAEAPDTSSSPLPLPEEPVPEDLQTPWGWPELLILVVVGLVSLIVLNNLMATAVVLWWGVKTSDIVRFATTNAIFISVRQALWSAALLLFLYVWIRRQHSAPFWRTIGWRPLKTHGTSPSAVYLSCVLGGIALAYAIEFASALFHTKSKLPIEALFHDRRGILWLMAIGILAAPVVEETIFRGFLYPVLARSFGMVGGVVVTGVLFGLLHAPQLWGGWGQIGLLALLGIVLTYARARSGTVLTSYLLHLSYNTCLFVGFYVFTGGLRHIPPGP